MVLGEETPSKKELLARFGNKMAKPFKDKDKDKEDKKDKKEEGIDDKE